MEFEIHGELKAPLVTAADSVPVLKVISILRALQ